MLDILVGRELIYYVLYGVENIANVVVFYIQSSFVVRLRKDVLFGVQESRPLTEKDPQAGVRTDDLGHLTGPQSKGNEGRRCRESKAPQQVLRRVVVWDEANQKEVILRVTALGK